ncbi:ABC-2 type transport system ATP-binding protein [Thiogranum longum]|uniref:ABC-2 type transport system ATP-binding protein n=1 Tax=Thiogranum longum TaxID=1537524 RepID=A0A4R1HCF2_9GAMM|nr:ATP-binding cassette domain-containing protein [Thiogranum longum]TCK17880.1 ABC-2 type transport system ATP-binding protein [Thiogranum longum]
MTGTASPAITLKDLGKTFAGAQPVRALDKLNLQVRRGIVTGLIGPDGAGKTTLMRLAAGLLLPDEGEIQVLGQDMREASLAVQSHIGYMPQRFGLYEDLTVQENLDLYAELQGVPEEEHAKRHRELMHMTGLAPFTARLAGRLSGGMKQKLGLACTLLSSPELLLLDEPTVGVDPVSRRELWAIVYRLVKQQHMSVLLSTAYLDEAERCDDVILLHEGKLLGQQTPQAFSAPMQGRVWEISAALGKRRLQQQLDLNPAVLDALTEGRKVRVVTCEANTPEQALVADLPDAHIESVAPRFEDAFIAMLQHDIRKPAAIDTTSETATTRNDEAVIQAHELSRRFGDFIAVNKVSFDVRRGEIFGLLGANGAGKSTTFRMLCGLLPVSSGHVSVAGVNLRKAAAKARARIGYMAQRFSLYGNLSVQENLNFFASAYGLSGNTKRERIASAVEDFELTTYRDTAAFTLPLGFKQRLALAAALMHRPDILFLDEPTSGVDPLARREFWWHINALAESGVTVLVTTHFMDEANYCDRLVVMADGEVLAADTPENLRERFHAPGESEASMEDAFIALIEQHKQEAAA